MAPGLRSASARRARAHSGASVQSRRGSGSSVSIGQDWAMRTVLLTGAAGQVGRVAARRLAGEGWNVRGFDVVTGNDLRDENSVTEAVRGCNAIVHAGAIAHDRRGTASDIVATNLLGTWHVLLAAERHAVARVVYFSSAQVFGFA